MDSATSPSSHPTAKGWPIYKEVGADMVGELIGRRHKILRRLAKGGMADVFLAKDLSRKAHVAIKILRSRSPESCRRFGVEGVVLSNLKHPFIVRAVDVGKAPDGQPYMALEYLEGESLSARLARGPMAWRDVAVFGSQIAGAVHALHAAGIVHRDLKPDNIMLTTEDDRTVAKLIDLGLARVGAPFQDAQDARFTPDPPARHQTQLGHPIGTPTYLPPEAGQCPAEPRLDVYSLGVTLYQLCTQLLPQATGGRPIREVCPASDAPDELSRLLQAAFAADVDERLPSADHMRRGLEAILAAHPRQRSPHLFGGSYDRLEVLGVGASAVVFRASDRALSREVAVKVLRDAEPSEDDAIRFRLAAKVLSALCHANIPRILHFGVHDDQSFAVTELCPGAPATVFVRPDSHLRPDETIAVGLQLAGSLAAVHAAGVVYRDLHPGNVLIAREPLRASIFDFDQAQVSPSFYAALTERWATPPEERPQPKHDKRLQNMDYAAPEVRAGAAFSAASDVYALGLLLYRLLTGKRPFPSSGGEPTPARRVCPACPRGLEGLLLAMLNPRPDMRPGLARIQTILEDEQAELAAELAEDETRDDPDDEAGPFAPAGDRTIEPVSVAVADTMTAGTASLPIPTTDIAAAAATTTDAEPASSGRLDVVAAPSPPSRARRSVGVWTLGLTAAACLVIGRATAARDEADPGRDATPLPAPPTIEATVESSEPSRPARAAEVCEPPMIAVDDAPPAVPVIAVKGPPLPAPKRDISGGHPRRGAVTSAEATAAAQDALPSLRTCKDVPPSVTADLEIVRGRGVVKALNHHAPAPDDPDYPWHGCAQRSLRGVRFPVSETAGPVQVRLTLR
ncbi:serine/threonine protein kinase [Nannocystis sp.]|uniref:protein kinase domain-containing protein n=1 Tax=Nannocystis sp. TaxID=1962667 RepID=UPI0025D29F53|nr:serine/threonine protein kinase [Nannocystis sp.]MBK7830737.1 protein kinase [Nannocystis sp.]